MDSIATSVTITTSAASERSLTGNEDYWYQVIKQLLDEDGYGEYIAIHNRGGSTLYNQGL